MDLDINKRQIGFFYIGQKVELTEKPICSVGYAVYVRNGVVSGIYVAFSEIVRHEEYEVRHDGKIRRVVSETPGLVFKDKLIKDGSAVEINSSSEPEDISRIFQVSCDYWDDDSCLGMSFTQGDCEFEFSWSWVGQQKKRLDYMLIEAVTSGQS